MDLRANFRHGSMKKQTENFLNGMENFLNGAALLVGRQHQRLVWPVVPLHSYLYNLRNPLVILLMSRQEEWKKIV